jgi:ribulose-phosphate 3-epimerase
MKFHLAPSLLAADPLNVGAAVEQVVHAGAQVLHIDVMDGHFVPNLTMGPAICGALKGKTQALLDVHLMVTDPDDFYDAFAAAGADWISFHIEAGYHPHRSVQRIRDLGCRPGVAINPGTPISALEAIIEDVDFVLLMSVNPGFGGQKFIPASLKRLDQLSALIAQTSNKPFIQIDGGVGPGNIAELVRRGVRCAVAGSSVFGADHPSDAVHEILTRAEAVYAT